MVGGLDHVPDAVAVVGQAHIALAQPGKVRCEVKVVADFQAAAAFRLKAEIRCFGRSDIGQVVVKAADFVHAGEAGHLRVAHEQAVVVGQVVADGNGRRPGMGAYRFGLRPALFFGVVFVDNLIF